MIYVEKRHNAIDIRIVTVFCEIGRNVNEPSQRYQPTVFLFCSIIAFSVRFFGGHNYIIVQKNTQLFESVYPIFFIYNTAVCIFIFFVL